MTGYSLSTALRVSVATALGIAVAGLLGRASDERWWQVLPWVLLAAFWVVLFLRRRGGTLRDRRG